MKIKLFGSAALALALIITTGCHHKPVAVTPIPGPAATEVPSMPPSPSYNNNQGPQGQGIAETGGGWDIANYNQNREALAAYTIHFAYDSAVIRDSDQASLQSIVSALSNPGTKLLIEGDCDERGTEEYNRSLGERRALAAREALAKLGVSPDRIRTISFGKDKPVDTGHDEAAWGKNRRADFVLLEPKAGA